MTLPRRVVLATGNAGKQREFAALLGPRDFEVLLQTALGIAAVAETGSTFEANSLLKARHAARVSRLPALADDSGLEVDALGGRPGVWSARYAGKDATDADNNTLLLHELDGIAPAGRRARFRCVITYVRHADDPAPLVATGAWEGVIALQPAGTGGFGYDPLFIPDGLAISAAEMSAADKNAVSHRGRALADLLRQLP